MTYADVILNYIGIKHDIDQLFETELEKIIARQSKTEESVQVLPILDDGEQGDEEGLGISR